MVTFFHDGLQEMIGDKVNLLFCNQDEALSFTKADNLTAAIDALLSVADDVVVTKDADGAVIADKNERLTIFRKTTAVDTNGAGDTFAGAYLYGITHGYTKQQAGDLASAAAAQLVSQYGPRLRREQYHTLMQQGLAIRYPS